jgi:hypothetical protein
VERGHRNDVSVENVATAGMGAGPAVYTESARARIERQLATNGTYGVLEGTFQGYEGTTEPFRSVAIITRGVERHNVAACAIHRFHRCESCVFHIIHRLRGVFGMLWNRLAVGRGLLEKGRVPEHAAEACFGLTGGESDAYIGSALRRCRRSSRRTSEAYLPTKRPQEGEDTWVPGSDVHARRTSDPSGSPS